MGMGLAGGAGAGAAADALQEILKQKFLETMSRQKLAEEQRQADMTNQIQQGQLGQGQQRIDLSGKQLTQEGEQFGQRLGLDTRKQDTEESQFAEMKPVRLAQTGHMQAQTDELLRKPAAEEIARNFTTGRDKTLHGYQLGEIGAQGANAVRVAGMRQEAAAGAPTPQQQNEVADSLALVNEIRSDPAIAKSVGPIEGRGAGMVTAGPEGYTRVKALHDNLVNKLQLAQASKLKGQGQISNMEREMLKNAATALDRTLGDPDYLTQLSKVEQQFQRMMGGSQPSGATGAGGPSGASTPQEFDYVPGKGFVPRGGR